MPWSYVLVGMLVVIVVGLVSVWVRFGGFGRLKAASGRTPPDPQRDAAIAQTLSGTRKRSKQLAVFVPRQVSAGYSDIAPLAHGGISQLFRGREIRSGRAVAIKCLSPLLREDRGAVERFGREIEALAMVDHPNVIRILESPASADGYYVMELFDAPTLKRRLDGATLDSVHVLEISKQLAAAIKHIHNRQVVHRDIKPENVLVHDDQTVKLIDFGLAKYEGSDFVTRPGESPGTAGYMSPERLTGATSDSSADIYSFGLLLIHVATGHSKIEDTGFPDACQFRPGFANPASDRLLELARQCVTPIPADRPTAMLVLKALEEIHRTYATAR